MRVFQRQQEGQRDQRAHSLDLLQQRYLRIALLGQRFDPFVELADAFTPRSAKRSLQGCGRSRSAKKRSRHRLAALSTAGYSADLRNAAIAGSRCR